MMESKIRKYLNEQNKAVSAKSTRLGDSFSLGGNFGDKVEKISELRNVSWYYDPRDGAIVGLFKDEVQLDKRTLSSIAKLPNFMGISFMGSSLGIDIDVSTGVPKGFLHKSFYDANGEFDPD